MQIRTATTSARALKRSLPATACSCGGTRSSLDLEQPRCRCPPAPRATAFRGRGGATSPSEKPLELPPSSHRSSICTEPPLLLTAPGRRLLPRIESTYKYTHPSSQFANSSAGPHWSSASPAHFSARLVDFTSCSAMFVFCCSLELSTSEIARPFAASGSDVPEQTAISISHSFSWSRT